MATINTSNGNWMTSFFYEQDLRSLYMNGALNSGFRPGIYNANMCLYTNADTAKGNLGLYLFIKKGTTLIFSNNYTLTSEGYYVRNLDQVGTYLIKCVAQEDISVQLITLTSGSYTNVCEKILGLNTTYPAAELFYIAATMIYDSENSTGYTVPKFRCVLKNTSWTPTPSYTSEDTNFFFTTPDTDVYKIPDGSVNYSTRNLISYLFLGAVKDVNWSAGTYYATTSGKWRAGTPAQDWINNHVFIGRGFPEYRQNLTADKILDSPEVIPDPNLQTLYLDAPSISAKDRIYSSTTDWRGVYNIGAYTTTGSVKFEMRTTDEQNQDLEQQISNFASAHSMSTGSSILVSDILFLSSRDRYSNEEGADLKDMFYLSEDYSGIVHGFDFRNTLKFHHLRWLSRCSDSFIGLDPAFEKESDRNAADISNITHDSYVTTSRALTGTTIVPLDVSEVNRNRLFSLLKNRNVIPAVINYMRRAGLLDPLKETDLIPAVVFFRKFVYSGSDWTSVDLFSSYGHTISGKTYGERFNPSNILNFFDLQFKTTKINNITTVSPEVFSVLPMME